MRRGKEGGRKLRRKKRSEERWEKRAGEIERRGEKKGKI